MSLDSSDLNDLYQTIILDHNKNPRHYGAISNHNHVVEGLNPLCGDRIKFYLDIEEGVLKSIGFETASCAICKASASVLCDSLTITSFSNPSKCISEGLSFIKDKEGLGTINEVNEDIIAFKGVHNFPARLQCALLPWESLNNYLSDSKH